MNLIKAIWDVLNGKKLNTGTIVVLGAIIIERVFGVSNQEATGVATSIMMGAGGVIMLVGYIHRLIKARQVTK